MTSACEKEWATCPNHDRTCVVDMGVKNSAIALVNLRAGFTVVGPISNPANCLREDELVWIQCDSVRSAPAQPVCSVVKCLLNVGGPHEGVVHTLRFVGHIFDY